MWPGGGGGGRGGEASDDDAQSFSLACTPRIPNLGHTDTNAISVPRPSEAAAAAAAATAAAGGREGGGGGGGGGGGEEGERRENESRNSSRGGPKVTNLRGSGTGDARERGSRPSSNPSVQ
jgi:hypothetical protein